MHIQNLTTSNFLLFEEISKIPFPAEVKYLIPTINWKETLWQTFGLPIMSAKYSLVSGKMLYLEELPEGTIKVLKQDFTGEVVASAMMLDARNLGDNHYIVSFVLTFLKGELIDIKFLQLETINKIVYEYNFKIFETKYKKNFRIRTSWWYLWLYRPYKYFIKVIFFIPLSIIFCVRWSLVKLLKLITPL